MDKDPDFVPTRPNTGSLGRDCTHERWHHVSLVSKYTLTLLLQWIPRHLRVDDCLPRNPGRGGIGARGGRWRDNCDTAGKLIQPPTCARLLAS